MVRVFILPACLEKFVQGVPVFKLQCCFHLELHNLEMFRDDVSLRTVTQLLGAYLFVGCRSKALAMAPNCDIVLELGPLVVVINEITGKHT
jgi:hypothetical protein